MKNKKVLKLGKIPEFEYRVRLDSFKARDKYVKKIRNINFNLL